MAEQHWAEPRVLRVPALPPGGLLPTRLLWPLSGSTSLGSLLPPANRPHPPWPCLTVDSWGQELGESPHCPSAPPPHFGAEGAVICPQGVADGRLAWKGKQHNLELVPGERSQQHLPPDALGSHISMERRCPRREPAVEALGREQSRDSGWGRGSEPVVPLCLVFGAHSPVALGGAPSPPATHLRAPGQGRSLCTCLPA